MAELKSDSGAMGDAGAADNAMVRIPLRLVSVPLIALHRLPFELHSGGSFP